jgi:hypothetical protein
MLPSSGAIVLQASGPSGDRPSDQDHRRLALGQMAPSGRICGVSTPAPAPFRAVHDHFVRRPGAPFGRGAGPLIGRRVVCATMRKVSTVGRNMGAAAPCAAWPSPQPSLRSGSLPSQSRAASRIMANNSAPPPSA